MGTLDLVLTYKPDSIHARGATAMQAAGEPSFRVKCGMQCAPKGGFGCEMQSAAGLFFNRLAYALNENKKLPGRVAHSLFVIRARCTGQLRNQ